MGRKLSWSLAAALAPAALAVAAMGAVTLVAGCGSDPPATFGAESAWARPTPSGASSGVIYLVVSSDVADELVAVEVPAPVAGAAELHATMEVGGDHGSHSHGGGDGGEMMAMGEVDGLAIGAGEAVELAPGGNHIMLIDLVDPLTRGEQFPVTLRFASGRSLEVNVVVADNPPG